MSALNQPNTAPKKYHDSIAFVAQFLVLGVLVLLFRSLILQPFTIPSASMVPTLLVGDYLAVTKYNYGFSRYSFPLSIVPFKGRIFGSLPERGDVVVFRFTHDHSIDFIKRVIGLPGDRIQIQDGKLFVDNNEVPREDRGPYEFVDQDGQSWKGVKYKETLPQTLREDPKHYKVLQVRTDNAPNNTMEYVVPKGCLFMMGDDRDDSLDSRFQGGREEGECAAPEGNDFLKSSSEDLGFVPVDNLVGRAQFVFFSIDKRYSWWKFWHWPQEIRWGRFFHKIS